MTRAEAYLPTKWQPDPSSCLATTDMGENFGVPLWGRESWVPIEHVAWAEAYLCTKWQLGPSSCLATIDMGCVLYGRSKAYAHKYQVWG